MSDIKSLFRNLFWISIVVTSICLTSCKSARIPYSSNRVQMKEHSNGTEKPTDIEGRSVLIQEAYSWIGTPYKYASAEKGCGTDCSGLVMKVYQSAIGYTLPRNSAKQAEFCEPVSDEEVAEGDLVFFATGSNPTEVSHVGIMVDNIKFIHASSSKGVVESKLTNPYYRRTFLRYGRVPSPAASR